MTTTRTQLTHGQYVDRIEVTVSGRLETDGGPDAYQVEDTAGERFLLVVETGEKFEVGNRYRIEAGLGVDPDFDEREAFDTQFDRADDHECPRCGGELAFDSGLFAATPATEAILADLDRGGVHLVVTGESRVSDPSADDDWRPMRETRSSPPTSHGEFRCSECGFVVSESDMERLLERLEAEGLTEERLGEGPVEFIEEPAAVQSAAPAADAAESIGMATGGGKDVDNFRENVAEGYLPDEDALTYEGLFYDYYFDTGDDDRDDGGLFYPTYSTAVSDDPIDGETEHYLSVGLNSSLGVEEFQRRRLNLVAVLDVSGSMSSEFDQYYYDEHGNRQAVESGAATKMEAATESLAAMTTHLDDDDRFGVVLFNSQEHVAKPLSLVSETDMDAIRGHIRDVRAGGGTNMTAGLETAIDLLGAYEDADPTAVENRIVFMTDMMPNTGATGENAITGTVEAAADRGIYTTFVGMGIDANPDLTESLSKVKGANHYFVHSAEEFRRRLDEEFEFMVTPLVFDLQLELDGSVDVDAVYGSPTADRSTGRLMHVPTLFPSPTEDGETRGGVVLLKLAGEPTGDLELVASWEEIDGTLGNDRVTVEFDATDGERFANPGIEKAVCLARYGRVLREWIRAVEGGDGEDDWEPMDGSRSPSRGQWERDSRPLHVPDAYRDRFETLAASVADTAEAVDDDTLEQEVELLERLVEHEDSETSLADLSATARDRLRVLAALAPTTNDELMEAWGMDSGSAVHAYLEAELAAFYERDEGSRIRLSDRGREVLREIRR